MDVLTLVITFAVIGFVTWLLITYVPMPAPIRTAIVVLVVILLVLFVVRLLGVPMLRIGP